MFSFPSVSHLIDQDRQERQIALEHLAEAWHSAETEGLESEAIAHAALFAALATLVSSYGEDATARLIAELPERIRSGEYTLDRTIQ